MIVRLSHAYNEYTRSIQIIKALTHSIIRAINILTNGAILIVSSIYFRLSEKHELNEFINEYSIADHCHRRRVDLLHGAFASHPQE